MVIAAEPRPTISDAAPARPALSTRSRIPSPCPTSPTTASASTSTASNSRRAPMLESAKRTPSTSRPLASFPTANRVTHSSDVEAPRSRPDREQGDAFIGPRGDEDQVRRGALHDELLAARQAEAVARALGSHRDRLGAVLGAFVDRKRADRVAGEDAGQP